MRTFFPGKAWGGGGGGGGELLTEIHSPAGFSLLRHTIVPVVKGPSCVKFGPLVFFEGLKNLAPLSPAPFNFSVVHNWVRIEY